MEQSFADLLSDAFSETSGPSFPDGDMDFENLNFSEENKTDAFEESQQTKEDDALHQEATSVPQAEDVNMEENDGNSQSDEEDFQGARVVSVDETLEDDYTSSEGDSEQDESVSGDDEGNEEEEEDLSAGEEPGDLLMSVCCSGDKEDRISAEGRPLAPQGAAYTEDRNKEQSDEEVSYFERVPERGGEMGIKGDRTEDDEKEREKAKQEDSSDSEHEGMKIKQEEEEEEKEEEDCFAQEVENPYKEDRERKDWNLEFPEISEKNLQDLLAEVEGEESVVKVEEFSGEEHQEAGESFADYPSDFSSCEYVEEKHLSRESSSAANQDGEGICMRRGEDIDEEEDEYLYSRNLEDVEYLRDLDGRSERKDRGMLELPEGGAECDDEESESDSCSSSDYNNEVKRRDEDLDVYTENLVLQEDKQHKDSQLRSGNRAEFLIRSTSDDYHREDAADPDITWNPNVSTTSTYQIEDLLTIKDTEKVETLLSGVTHPAEDLYSSIEREGTRTVVSSNHGSLDDSFFFNTRVESFGITELSQQADDEEEDERNWDQEKERIKAFYKFYDDSDKEERQTKVQFCADPLSRVIRYESESDRDSTSSSTDVEEDLSSAEISEQELREPVIDNNMEKKPKLVSSNAEIQDVQDLRTTPVCTRKQKCLSVLKLTLKMAAVIVMGLLMFWSITD